MAFGATEAHFRLGNGVTGMAFEGCGWDIVVLLFWYLICLYKGSQLPYYFTLSSIVFIFNLGDS
jgi:hypothetical protein